MKIPIYLEITPNLNVATFYRQCARCKNLIGPIFTYEVHTLADIAFCETCTSLFSTRKNLPKDVA